jgi:hypothetical protein
VDRSRPFALPERLYPSRATGHGRIDGVLGPNDRIVVREGDAAATVIEGRLGNPRRLGRGSERDEAVAAGSPNRAAEGLRETATPLGATLFRRGRCLAMPVY